MFTFEGWCLLLQIAIAIFDQTNFSTVFFLSFWSPKPWIRIGSSSGFTWNAGSVSGSGINEFGSTALICLHCRNNVLHLWPYNIHDLKALGAKKFYGKFCAGSIDHISIRWPQSYSIPVQNQVTHLFHPCPKPGRGDFYQVTQLFHPCPKPGRAISIRLTTVIPFLSKTLGRGDFHQVTTIIPSLSKTGEGQFPSGDHNYFIPVKTEGGGGDFHLVKQFFHPCPVSNTGEGDFHKVNTIIYSIPVQNRGRGDFHQVTPLFHHCPKPGRGNFHQVTTDIPSLSKIGEGGFPSGDNNYSIHVQNRGLGRCNLGPIISLNAHTVFLNGLSLYETVN